MITANVVLFGRLLRRVGLSVTPASTETFATALTLIGFGNKRLVRAAGRACYLKRREDRDLFDRAFDLFWRRYAEDPGGAPLLPKIRQDNRKPPTFPAALPGVSGTVEQVEAKADIVEASAAEQIRAADFASLTPEEARDAYAMIAALRPVLPARPSRRWQPTRRPGGRPASAQMLRAALATSAEPLRWWWLAHPRRQRPLVLITDISGSMERYSRLMLRFAHTLSRLGAPLEVFVFGTRLTRITRELKTRDPDAALERVGHAVVDWNGGTRIGESIRELNQRWVRRTIRSGALVLVVSDGWERGDSSVLGREMARLRRSCYRLYWLDPLASQPGFVPEVAGLKAALPHVDELLPCASVASLEDLARRLATATMRRQRRGPNPVGAFQCVN